ncbi:hypothetical protein PJL15_03945 [Paenarthrobacter nitroguajacolicus]|nr:hypothetical protein [Paenarthrobacter nitroguajacolicus]
MATRFDGLIPSASATFDVIDVCSRQVPDSGSSHLINHIPPLSSTLGRVSQNKTSCPEGIQETIQTRSADINDTLQLTNGRGSEDSQLAQDIRLSPTSHEGDGGLYIQGQARSNQSRHASILPDSSQVQPTQIYITLLLNNRVRPLWHFSSEICTTTRVREQLS